MANVDPLLLARYGIIQVTPQGEDGDVVVVLRPLSKLTNDERRGLYEMACLSLESAGPHRSSRRRTARVVADDDALDLGSCYRDDDEGLIDEA